MSPFSSFEALRRELRAEMELLRERMVVIEAENRALRAQGPPAHPLEPAEVLALQAENRQLRAELERLRRGKKNSSNSGKPPSSDHPHDPKSERDLKTRKPDPATERQQGGQPGHPGASRALLPPGSGQIIVACIPQQCGACAVDLVPDLVGPDPAPRREQVWELPPVPWEIYEYQRHCRTCPQCGERSWGQRPPDAPVGCLGFRAQAEVGLLTGGAQLSRRAALTLLQERSDLPLSLGKLSSVEDTLRQALATAYAEVQAAVAAAPVVYCDETPWRDATGKPWLWTAATPEATLFRIAPQRNKEAFASLKLDTPGQIKVTDRYSVYIHSLDRQEHALCWSHLDRDFQSWLGHNSVAHPIAHWLADETAKLFQHWHAFQAGECDRPGLAVRMADVQTAMKGALQWGAQSGVAKFQGLCGNLLEVWDSLWTFVRVEGVEPTNNRAERAVRPGVLWRKTSLFSQSERGKEYVERMLTVKTTLRQRGGNLLEFLTDTLRAAHLGVPPPKLFPAATA